MTHELLTDLEWLAFMTGPPWDEEQLADMAEGNLRKAYRKHIEKIGAPPIIRVEGETQ